MNMKKKMWVCGGDAPADGDGSEGLTTQVNSSFVFSGTKQVKFCFVFCRRGSRTCYPLSSTSALAAPRSSSPAREM